MRTSALAMSAALVLAAAQASWAQRPQEPPRVLPPSQAVTVSDADLDTFAAIYADLLDTVEKFEAELDLAQTEEQARDIQSRAQTESIAKIEQRGWTPARFNSVGEAINRDPELTDRAVKLIEEK